MGSTLAYLTVPSPTGAYPIGKGTVLLTDPARPEAASPEGDDLRQVRVVTWYPAQAATGTSAAYLTDLPDIADALVASGQVGALEVAGLGLVRDHARVDAAVASDSLSYPVLLLSPGNATNVEFYSGLAEDLASHGYVVVGIDHPYQVAATKLDSGVATYAGEPPLSDAADVIPGRIAERVADIGFVLDRLEADAAGIAALAGRLDMTSIGLIGHSNGGIAAAEACADPRVDACANLDGQLAGGPFGSKVHPATPVKPFLYVTKEIEIHPAIEDIFERSGAGTFRVVVPGAAHDQFADGAVFRPRVLPMGGAADHTIEVARGFSRAFFDHVLRGEPREVFGDVSAPMDVTVMVYPLVPPD